MSISGRKAGIGSRIENIPDCQGGNVGIGHRLLAAYKRAGSQAPASPARPVAEIQSAAFARLTIFPNLH